METVIASAVAGLVGIVFSAWRLKGGKSLKDTLMVVARGGGGPGTPEDEGK